MLTSPDRLLDAIRAPRAGGDDVAESVLTLLAPHVAHGRDLQGLYGVSRDADLDGIKVMVEQMITSIQVPAEVVAAHPGVRPPGMARLLAAMDQRNDLNGLLLDLPESHDAARSYLRAFALCKQHLGANLGPEGRRYQLAILVVSWMRGMPLAQLIDERLEYFRGSGRSFTTAAVIRGVMDDVETVARFKAPKFLACYLELLKHSSEPRGLAVDDEDFLDVTMMLELGVSRRSEVSLMSLGLSRTTVVGLSRFIVPDDWTAAQCLGWLRAADLEALDLPALVVREVRTMLATRAAPDADAG